MMELNENKFVKQTKNNRFTKLIQIIVNKNHRLDNKQSKLETSR